MTRRKLGVARGTAGLLSRTTEKRTPKTKEREIRASYLLPASIVKRAKLFAVENERPVKKVVQEALERFLPKKR